MSGRELLELAANAIGKHIPTDHDRELMRQRLLEKEALEAFWYQLGDIPPRRYSDLSEPRPWNPLVNDGAALRLAVELNLDVFQAPKLGMNNGQNKKLDEAPNLNAFVDQNLGSAAVQARRHA
ncbi:MAG: hypothetical protein ABI155_14275 [Paralcaligenes sp.]